MKFTIAIPCYNQAEYLPEAVESALAQTTPAEIIVVDDGSTDESWKIAESYKDKGVKVIHQANKGLASARNTAIMNMTGDYFLPLDADDILLEKCVEVMDEACQDGKVDVIAPSFKTFGVREGTVILSQLPRLEDFLIANRMGYFSAIKKTVLQEVGGYNPKMTLGYEDWDLWIDIFKRNHSLCMISEVLVLYRTKATSMLTEADKHRGLLISQMNKNHPTLRIL